MALCQSVKKILASVIVVAAIWHPVVAQETGDEIVLEGIVVTARKIEEPVQKVPFGISVFDRTRIESEDIRDARSFGRQTPGFNFVDTGIRGSNVPNIRGVGSFFPQSSDDASVPVFIDGIPLAVRSQDRELFDADRIEVLRGPQNSIFGRNAQAGAINVITANPTLKPFFEVGTEVGNFDGFRLSAIASGPITSTLSGRVSAQVSSRDGDIPDLNLDDDVRDQRSFNANGKLVWKPSVNTDVTLSIRHGKYDEQPTQGVYLEDPDFPRHFQDFAIDYKLQTLATGVTVKHRFAKFNFTGVTGFQRYKSSFVSDDTDGFIFNALTGLPPQFANAPGQDFRDLRDDDRQFTQEFRLDGKFANGTRWVVGANYFQADLDFDILFNSTGFINADFDNSFTTTSFSGYGEVTVPITTRLRAIGGIRLTREKKDFTSQVRDLSGFAPQPSASDNGDETFNLVTGRAGLSYDFVPSLTGFVTAARGAKAGGFQLTDTDLVFGAGVSEFESAFTWTYEAGVRGKLLDNRIDISLSVFFNDTKDEHVQVFDFTTFQSVIENLDTETYGLEIEGAVRPVAGLTLFGGFSLLETEIVATDDPTVSVGNEVPFAPKVTFNLAAQYTQPVALFGLAGDMYGRVEYQYVGSRTVDPQNSFDLGSFDIVNIRAGWNSDNFSIYGFVTNVFDETYAETAFLFGQTPSGDNASLAIPGQPRRFGVGTKIRF